jgi:hypothetical protein
MLFDGLLKFIEKTVSKFRKKAHVSDAPSYELVEHDIDGNHFRQGIRILNEPYVGIVVTLLPSVKIEPTGDTLKVLFDFTVESNPNHVEYTYRDLHSHLGAIVVDIILKDYA